MVVGRDATAELGSLGTSPTSSEASEVAIGDATFCTHGKEQCRECGVDTREDNALTYGLDFIENREGLEIEYSLNKDGVAVCKKHKTSECTHLNIKKLIDRENKAAKKNKAGR